MATATVRPDLLRRSTPSLGTYLGALVSAALLSALAMGGAAAWTAARGQRTALEAGLQDTARALVLAIDAEISGRIAALTVLAGPRVQPEAGQDVIFEGTCPIAGGFFKLTET